MPSLTFYHLPTELKSIIVEELLGNDGRDDVLVFCLVSHPLRAIGQRILFSYVEIISSLSLIHFVRALSNDMDLATFLSTLSINCDTNLQRNQQDVTVANRQSSIAAMVLIIESCKTLKSIRLEELSKPHSNDMGLADFNSIQASLNPRVPKIENLRSLTTAFNCSKSSLTAIATIFPKLVYLDLMFDDDPEVVWDFKYEPDEEELRTGEIRISQDSVLFNNLTNLKLAQRWGGPLSFNEVAHIGSLCPGVVDLELSGISDLTTHQLACLVPATSDVTIAMMFRTISNTLSAICLYAGRTRQTLDGANRYFSDFVQIMFKTCPNINTMTLEVEGMMWTDTLAVLEDRRICGDAIRLQKLGFEVVLEMSVIALPYLGALLDWVKRRHLRQQDRTEDLEENQINLNDSEVLPALEDIRYSFFTDEEEEDSEATGMLLRITEFAQRAGITASGTVFTN